MPGALPARETLHLLDLTGSPAQPEGQAAAKTQAFAFNVALNCPTFPIDDRVQARR